MSRIGTIDPLAALEALIADGGLEKVRDEFKPTSLQVEQGFAFYDEEQETVSYHAQDLECTYFEFIQVRFETVLGYKLEIIVQNTKLCIHDRILKSQTREEVTMLMEVFPSHDLDVIVG